MSRLETELALQLKAAKLPEPEREAQLIPGRRWRCDFAWTRPEQRLVVEVEGGVWRQGRHTRGSGFIKDCEKYAALVLAGWRVLRVTEPHIRSGQALAWIEEALRR